MHIFGVYPFMKVRALFIYGMDGWIWIWYTTYYQLKLMNPLEWAVPVGIRFDPLHVSRNVGVEG